MHGDRIVKPSENRSRLRITDSFRCQTRTREHPSQTGIFEWLRKEKSPAEQQRKTQNRGVHLQPLREGGRHIHHRPQIRLTCLQFR